MAELPGAVIAAGPSDAEDANAAPETMLAQMLPLQKEWKGAWGVVASE